MIQNIKVDKGEVTMSNKNLDESMETFLNGNESHRNNMETIEDFLNSEIGADVDEEEIEEPYRPWRSSLLADSGPDPYCGNTGGMCGNPNQEKK